MVVACSGTGGGSTRTGGESTAVAVPGEVALPCARGGLVDGVEVSATGLRLVGGLARGTAGMRSLTCAAEGWIVLRFTAVVLS